MVEEVMGKNVVRGVEKVGGVEWKLRMMEGVKMGLER